MMKLSGTLTETIKAIDQEAGPGIGGVGRQLQEKFKGWRNEVDMVSCKNQTGSEGKRRS